MSAVPAGKHIGWATASTVVIASMIGVGVFSTLSYQVHSLNSPFAILVLWAAGAVIALLGALCYAELGAALPRSGGEYHLLGRSLHPALGFLAGWVSLIAGFAAPIAAAAMAFAAYAGKISPLVQAHPIMTAVNAVALVTIVHMIAVGVGAKFQVVMTSIKLLLMLGLVAFAFGTPAVAGFSIAPTSQDLTLIASAGFATSLVWVSYAYSGWNAAIYVAGETKDPQRTLPLALAASTIFVGLVYLLVNYAFMRVVPTTELLSINPFAQSDGDMVSNELAVGFLAGKHIFGDTGGKIVGALIAICMVSTISAMVFTGPRVLTTMAQDYRFLAILAPKREGESPLLALGLQWAVVTVLLATAKFETVMKYIGITLSLFTCLTVIGMMRLRITEPNLPRPFKTPLYPLTPILFLLANAWMIYYLGQSNLSALYASAITIVSGLVIYFLIPSIAHTSNNK